MVTVRRKCLGVGNGITTGASPSLHAWVQSSSLLIKVLAFLAKCGTPRFHLESTKIKAWVGYLRLILRKFWIDVHLHHLFFRAPVSTQQVQFASDVGLRALWRSFRFGATESDARGPFDEFLAHPCEGSD